MSDKLCPIRRPCLLIPDRLHDHMRHVHMSEHTAWWAQWGKVRQGKQGEAAESICSRQWRRKENNTRGWNLCILSACPGCLCNAQLCERLMWSRRFEAPPIRPTAEMHRPQHTSQQLSFHHTVAVSYKVHWDPTDKHNTQLYMCFFANI